MAAYGITSQGVHDDVSILEGAFNTIQAENIHLNKKLDALEAVVHQLKAKNFDQKTITDKRGFDRLAVFTGEEKMFGDWEFKLHQFIRSETGLESFLDDIKDLEKRT